jgi:hypothetical protein
MYIYIYICMKDESEDMKEMEEVESPDGMMFEREGGQEAPIKAFIDEEVLLAEELKVLTEEKKLQKMLLFEQKTKYEKRISLLCAFRMELQEISMCNLPLHPWYVLFGRDPVYGTKRLARITNRSFKQAICTKNMRLYTRFGIVYVKEPAVFSSLSDGDMVEDKQMNRDLRDKSFAVTVKGVDRSSSLTLPPTTSKDPINSLPQDLESKQGTLEGQLYKMSELSDLRRQSAFLNVYVPTFNSDFMHKGEALLLLHVSKTPYIGELHIASSLDVKQTVNRLVVMIQCLRRQIKVIYIYIYIY